MLEYTSIWNWVPLCIQWNFRSEKLYSWSTMSEFRIFYSNIIHVLHRCSCNIRWWIKSFSCMKITRRRTIKRTTRRNVGVVFLRWRNKFIIRRFRFRSRWNQNFFCGYSCGLEFCGSVTNDMDSIGIDAIAQWDTQNVLCQCQGGALSNRRLVSASNFRIILFS